MITAKLRNLHIAPRKVRLIADTIRGKSAQDAQAILSSTVKKGAQPMLNLLNSALSNGKNNLQLDAVNLYISNITVDAGPKLKRWRARARGSANTIEKKTSHVNLVLDEIKKLEKVKKVDVAAPKRGEPPAKGEARSEERRPEESGREKAEKIYQPEKPKLKRETVTKVEKPKIGRGIKRLFRRKVF